MENIYDDPCFFRQYAQMPRSREGLESAGEWHQLQPLFPPLGGKDALDLGCGYGWHCRYMKSQGARRVLGIDQSEKMLAEARKKGGDIHYRLCAIQDYDYPENTWDLVVCNLVLHYLPRLEPVYARIHRTLRPEGVFLFNIEHPVFTAAPHQDWVCDQEGRPLCWPVDDYFRPGPRETHFLGCTVTKYHHTLTQILSGLLEQGFVLERVEEAMPPASWLRDPAMALEMRRPMMLLVRAKKGEKG